MGFTYLSETNISESFIGHFFVDVW